MERSKVEGRRTKAGGEKTSRAGFLLSTFAIRPSTLSAILIMFAVANARAIGPAEIWPANVKAPVDPAVLAQQLAAIRAGASAYPAQLWPAIDFQKVFLQMITAAPEQAWLDDLKKLVALTGDDLVTATVRDKARFWLARIEMKQIDVALRKYYADKVVFPDSLDVVKKDIPENLRVDPWGKPWVYKLGKANFSKLPAQRYNLVSADYPQLTPMKEAIGDRNPPARPWKITTRSLGTSLALVFQSTATGHATVVMPGGKVDDCTMIFAGPNWALMASFDQFFVVGF